MASVLIFWVKCSEHQVTISLWETLVWANLNFGVIHLSCNYSSILVKNHYKILLMIRVLKVIIKKSVNNKESFCSVRRRKNFERNNENKLPLDNSINFTNWIKLNLLKIPNILEGYFIEGLLPDTTAVTTLAAGLFCCKARHAIRKLAIRLTWRVIATPRSVKFRKKEIARRL